jgi:chemotaxis protein MotA
MSLSAFFDPVALCFVVGATVSVAIVQNGAATTKKALGALKSVLWTNTTAREEQGHLAVLRIEHIVESRGINCADRVKAGGTFVTNAAEMMANERSPSAFEQAMQRLAIAQRNEATNAVRFWENMADAAPPIGMLGTVVGLIMLFGQVDDAAAIGRAMAISLLTSLYGLALANLIAGPISQRLARIYSEELGWQEDVAHRLIDLGHREYPEIALDGLEAHNVGHEGDAQSDGTGNAPLAANKQPVSHPASVKKPIAPKKGRKPLPNVETSI